VFVVGGAAMALAYDAARVTRDVDARFIPHGIVIEEARRVADDLGLPYWWLNEQASVYSAAASCSAISAIKASGLSALIVATGVPVGRAHQTVCFG
jgi:hypothetical protein